MHLHGYLYSVPTNVSILNKESMACVFISSSVRLPSQVLLNLANDILDLFNLTIFIIFWIGKRELVSLQNNIFCN